MNASDAWREVATRKISLTPALGFWVASVDQNGDRPHNRKRAVRSVSAVSSTPIAAIRDLVAKLDGAVQTTEMVVEAGDIQW